MARRWALPVATALLLAVFPGIAGSADPAAAGGAARVACVSGGIGETEQQQLNAREKEFNLKLVLSLVQGNYVADVDVVISDGKGARIAECAEVGPFLMVKLPAGQGTIAAVRLGKTVTRKVAVATGRLRTEYLRWPADPENDFPVSRWLDRE